MANFAVAGTSAFSKIENGTTIAGILSFVVAVLTASITFIKPNDKASLHRSAGNKVLSHRNDTRSFMDILLPQSAIDVATKALAELNLRRNTLN